MKKSIYLLFALVILSMVACKHPNTNKDAKMTEDLMAKENKSLVQEKKYTSKEAHWTVKLTGELKDTRTIEEKLADVPRKEDIVNTVTFDGRPATKGVKSSKGMYFKVYLELQKTVKYGTKKITFVLKSKLMTPIVIKASETQPIQIKFSNNDVVDIHNVDITYQKNNDPEFEYLDVNDTIMKAELSLDIINRLRTAQSNITIVFNASDDSFTLPLPPIFIEYLKEF